MLLLSKVYEGSAGKDGAKGAAATRHHAEAMKIEDLGHMMNWSEQQVPSATVGQRLRTINQQQTEGRYLMLKHVMMRAFLSSGFTLWTRRVQLSLSKILILIHLIETSSSVGSSIETLR